MGRELQKKKRRANRQPVRQPNRSKKVLNPRGNSVIAKNWDKKETLAQNYRRLGLLARLKTPAGGTEKKLTGAAVPTTTGTSKNDPFAIATLENAVVSEAKVERGPDGKIIRIIGHGSKENPLNDPLRNLDSDDDDEDDDEDEDAEWGGIAEEEVRQEGAAASETVKALIEESHNPAPKKPRHQSEQEVEWLQRLVRRYGEDTRAMARDRKMNPMQQTERDIARRIKRLGITRT